MLTTRAPSLLLGVLSVTCLAIAGCDHPAPAPRYLVQSGTVTTCSFDTGELTIATRQRTAGPPRAETVDCVVTKDSEVYVNGRFARFDAINVGDAVTLVGYQDPNPRSGRFVVSYAYFEHHTDAHGDVGVPVTQPAAGRE